MFERQINETIRYTAIRDDGFYPNTSAGDNPAYVADLRHVNLVLVLSDSFIGTIKVTGSTQKDVVNFSQASTIDNSWTYVNSVEMSTDDRIDGPTGLVFTGAEDGTYILQLNTDLLSWAGIEISGYTDGAVDFFFTGASNQ